MANGLLGYQQRQGLSEVFAAREQQKEQAFMAGLLRQAVESTGEVDVSGTVPSYEPGLTDFLSKDAALNAYIMHKKGKVSDEQLLAFNERFKQIDGMRQGKVMENLARLSTMGYDDAQLQKMVEGNSGLYRDVVDTILRLEASGDEGMASAALLKSRFLPQESKLESYGTAIREHPGTIGLGLLGAGAVIAKVAPTFATKWGNNPEAIKAFEDKMKGKYIQKKGVWYQVAKDKIGRVMPGKLGRKVASSTNPNFKGATQQILNDAKAATGPTNRQALKNLFAGKGGAGILGYTGAYAAPMLGRALLGEEGGRAGAALGGAYLGKSAIQKFAAGVAARHMAAAPSGPWGQVGAGLLDLLFAAPLLYDAFTGDE